jgi:uncharacterized DUF497 family protein
MMLHENFEWDEDKAQRNLRKHGVSFDDAALVLADEDGDRFHVEEFDEQHRAGEDRYVTTASHPDDRSIVLLVAWTDRSTDQAKVTRIISARAATPAERRRYGKEISG